MGGSCSIGGSRTEVSARLGAAPGRPENAIPSTPVPPPTLRILAAREECLLHINALIARSKSYWSWPADYLSTAKLRPSSEGISSRTRRKKKGVKRRESR